METCALCNLVKVSLEPLPKNLLPDKPLEGNFVAEQLKQMVTGYEAPVKSTASGSDESLPPEYEQELTQEKQERIWVMGVGEKDDDADPPTDFGVCAS